MAAFQVAAIDHQLRRSVQPVEVHDEPVLLGFAVDTDFFHFDARGEDRIRNLVSCLFLLTDFALVEHDIGIEGFLRG